MTNFQQLLNVQLSRHFNEFLIKLDGYFNEFVIKTLPIYDERQLVGKTLMFIGGIMLMCSSYLWWQITVNSKL
jgi:hypothetical protein